MCGEVTSPSSSSRVDSLCASLESAVVNAHLLLQSKTSQCSASLPWMSTMDGGSSDWWIYLSVNNHVAPSIAMVPWDTAVVVVVVYRLQTMATTRMAAIQWIVGTHLTYNRRGCILFYVCECSSKWSFTTRVTDIGGRPSGPFVVDEVSWMFLWAHILVD